jgi:hypothetical protein
MEVSEEKELKKLSNHIIVCGIHSSLYHFILPLRAAYLKNYLQDIVIISPLDTIPSPIWDTISRFTNIFLVFGSPLDKSVLRRAQIKKAGCAVILGFDPSLNSDKSHEVNDEMLDAQSIFIYKAIKGLNPTLQILTELN